MFKKVNDILIDPGEPFKNDVLKREPYADALTNLINSLSQPIVLSINGSWGTGKTTFLDMWRAKLKNEHFTCIHFNAWKNDFSEDPFISFVLEIEEEIKGLVLKGKKRKKVDGLITDLKSAGSDIIKYGLPLAVRLLSQGLINIDTETDKAIDSALTKATEGKLDQYSKMKISISSFKEKLFQLSQELKDGENIKPIVIFVDELDRCRPSYAIKLLENIKHLFDIEGYVFVLGIDRKQLGHTVESFYGQGMDSDGYLKRFIDIEYPLPDPSTEDYINFLINQLNMVEDVFKERKDGDWEIDNIRITFKALADIFQLSLRVQNQCMTQINFAIRIIPKNNHFNECTLTFLIILKHIERDKFKSLQMNKNYSDWIELIEGNSKSVEFRTTNNWFLIKSAFLYSQNISHGRNKVNALIDTCTSKSKAVNNSDAVKEEYSQIADIIGWYRDYRGYDICKNLINSIELSNSK
jgi:KAP-like P-loop domain-containing protein